MTPEEEMSLFPFEGEPVPEGDVGRMGSAPSPLADRMRPRSLEEFAGQRHLLGEGQLLRRMAKGEQLTSVILWGPPGCGKTALAHVIARNSRAHFVFFSAVLSGVKELRQVIEEARKRLLERHGQPTILFVDEIHRFNKAQQDAFLPHVEKGTVTLIGATTENPSFELIAPLLSRCRVLVLKRLEEEDLLWVLERALGDRERGLSGRSVRVGRGHLEAMARYADGDARIALTTLELAVEAASRRAPGGEGEVLREDLEDALQRRALLYDKAGEEHYNLISALHKSLRDSDPDAAIYWLARMLEAGEDPLYVARRLVRFASEDVGNAEPQALVVAVAAMQAAHFLGMPEADNALAQAALYLATAPKSNSVYAAYGRARREVAETQSLPVPLHIRNAPTSLMQDLGYGRGYRYAHDEPDHFAGQDNLPEELRGRQFYDPSDQGFEAAVSQRLERWRRLRARGRPASEA